MHQEKAAGSSCTHFDKMQPKTDPRAYGLTQGRLLSTRNQIPHPCWRRCCSLILPSPAHMHTAFQPFQTYLRTINASLRLGAGAQLSPSACGSTGHARTEPSAQAERPAARLGQSAAMKLDVNVLRYLRCGRRGRSAAAGRPAAAPLPFSFYGPFNRAGTHDTDWGARGNGSRPAVPTRGEGRPAAPLLGG